MKIIQIVGGGFDSDGNEGTIYGLGDDGGLYIWCEGYNPRVVVRCQIEDGPNGPTSVYGPDGKAVYNKFYGNGRTKGWWLQARSDQVSVEYPHPEDPNRAEKF